MKILSAIIAIAAAGPLMVDGNGVSQNHFCFRMINFPFQQVLNWHGPHGGHHNFFDGVEYTHGGHGGPRDAEGIAVHGHGPHGGHAEDAKVPYAEVMAELKQQKKERMEAAAAEKHEHSHGHGHGNGHSHGHGHGHHGHGHHGARGGGAGY